MPNATVLHGHSYISVLNKTTEHQFFYVTGWAVIKTVSKFLITFSRNGFQFSIFIKLLSILIDHFNFNRSFELIIFINNFNCFNVETLKYIAWGFVWSGRPRCGCTVIPDAWTKFLP